MASFLAFEFVLRVSFLAVFCLEGRDGILLSPFQYLKEN